MVGNQYEKIITCIFIIHRATLTAIASDSVDISAIGAITPPSCMPTASGGGVVDYG
ncbi:DUF1120 domain-containing protein [Providencia manganoxydans]|uniref:DUF1120 domain-containing protein n=1 Tax=Providencia manganoxydans TaxID=2923283 RepID=UPI003AF3644B